MSLIGKVYTANDMRAAAKCLSCCEVDLKFDNRDIARMLRQAADMMDREVGNASKMREALEKVLRVLHCAIVADILKGDDVNGAYNEVIAALSAPPRNCDVGTAEEQEKRFNSFCKTHLSGTRSICSAQCPCVGCRSMFHCLTKWEQMPYEEGGDE